jgi:hypothetical protein
LRFDEEREEGINSMEIPQGTGIALSYDERLLGAYGAERELDPLKIACRERTGLRVTFGSYMILGEYQKMKCGIGFFVEICDE